MSCIFDCLISSSAFAWQKTRKAFLRTWSLETLIMKLLLNLLFLIISIKEVWTSLYVSFFPSSQDWKILIMFFTKFLVSLCFWSLPWSYFGNFRKIFLLRISFLEVLFFWGIVYGGSALIYRLVLYGILIWNLSTSRIIMLPFLITLELMNPSSSRSPR